MLPLLSAQVDDCTTSEMEDVLSIIMNTIAAYLSIMDWCDRGKKFSKYGTFSEIELYESTELWLKEGKELLFKTVGDSLRRDGLELVDDDDMIIIVLTKSWFGLDSNVIFRLPCRERISSRKSLLVSWSAMFAVESEISGKKTIVS